MLFTSFAFAIFLPVVFILYWFVFNRKLRHQNLLVLSASYFFYGWWDWRFLSLIFISSVTDYLLGLKLVETTETKRKKILLGISLSINLGFLGVFKYYNFFIDSFVNLMSNLGMTISVNTLNIILPVGISFYTFQTLSYTIDIYKGKLKPTKDIIAFFAFVSFFPQLVAGPIERASSLLPQFLQKRHFRYNKARDGMQQILWGFFKKIYVADVLARQVDYIFENFTNLSGSALALGAVFFAFQIYCDFSAYSDIAIGIAKLFDFNLTTNFATPYFSRSISEFWRRWHITLSTWFRDYLYIPMGGSYGSKAKTIRNILVTFTISGLWHGANWTFIIWGFLNGLYLIPSLFYKSKTTEDRDTSSSRKLLFLGHSFIQVVTTFTLITISWVFFRSDSISGAFNYLISMFSNNLFTLPTEFIVYLLPIVVLLAIEWTTKEYPHPFRKVDSLPIVFRWSVYLLFSIVIIA
ncbi:MAG: MBOAT family protein, partial [Bacteroidales bacterium]|nr:MBOAT family protein [Bacteroidales bacterium]